MGKRSRSKYDSYIERFAEVYVGHDKNSSAAARTIRRRFPSIRDFKDGQLADWIRENRHGFADAVERAEQKALAAAATDVETWLEMEIQSLAERERQYREAEAEELKSNPSKAIKFGYLINKMSEATRHHHRLLADLREARNEGNLERYREVVRECLSLKRKRKSA